MQVKRREGLLVRPNPTEAFEMKPSPIGPFFTDIDPTEVLVVDPGVEFGEEETKPTDFVPTGHHFGSFGEGGGGLPVRYSLISTR